MYNNNTPAAYRVSTDLTLSVAAEFHASNTKKKKTTL